MRNLAKGGRAAVIVPEGVSVSGGPDQKVRKELLEHFNVHTILSLPAGCFLPYTGVKTNVLFFDRPSKNPEQASWQRRRVVLRVDKRWLRASDDTSADRRRSIAGLSKTAREVCRNRPIVAIHD